MYEIENQLGCHARARVCTRVHKRARAHTHTHTKHIQVELLSYKDHTHGLTETPKGEGDGLVNMAYFFRAA